jgi:hypothetical protein
LGRDNLLRKTFSHLRQFTLLSMADERDARDAPGTLDQGVDVS